MSGVEDLDPLSPYRPDQPLSDADCALLACLKGEAPLESLGRSADECALLAQIKNGVSFKGVAWIEQESRRFLRWNGQDPAATLGELNPFSQGLFIVGAYPLLKLLTPLALRLALAALPEDDPMTLESLNALGVCHSVTGNAVGALPLLEEAAARRRASLGSDHPDTLISLNNLANCYEWLGQAQRALPLYEAYLAGTVRDVNASNVDTIRALNNVAQCRERLGASSQALPLYEAAMSKARAGLEENHPMTLTVSNNFAACLIRLGDWQHALSLCERLLPRNRAVLGVRHPDSLMILAHLATCCMYLGDLRRAFALAQEAVALRIEVLGEKHPDTLSSLHTLASCYLIAGKYEDALALLEQLVAVRRVILGEAHPDVLIALTSLASCHTVLGQSDHALPMYVELHSGLRGTLGPHHPDTLICLNNLAYCLMSAGKFQDALGVHEEGAAASRATLGPNHPYTFFWEDGLVRCREAVGDDRDALALREDVARRALEVLGLQHHLTLGMLHDLAIRYVDCNDADRLDGVLPRLLNAVSASKVRNRSWAQYAANVTALLGQRDAVPVSDWVEILPSVSRALIEELDLAEPQTRAGLLSPFMQFHAAWLILAARFAPTEIPKGLAAMQGREMAAMLLDELQSREATLPPADVRSEFLRARHDLRRLRLQLISHMERPASPVTEDRSASYMERLQAEHDQIYANVLSLRRRLESEHPDFGVTAAPLAADVAELRAKLPAKSALVLLFSVRADRSENLRSNVYFAWTLRSDVGALPSVVHLPLMSVLIEGLQLYGLAEAANRDGQRQVDAEARSVAERPANTVRLEALLEAVREVLWQPLEAALAGVESLHVTTHDDFHNLPIAATAPAGMQLFVYPGFTFYYQRHHLLDPDPDRASFPVGSDVFPTALLALHVDAAADSYAPIPFVAVDAASARSVFGSSHVRGLDTQAVLDLWEDPNAARYCAWYFASHGTVYPGPPRQACLYLDMKEQKILDMARILTSAQRPRVLVIGCCLGARMHDDREGNALGLLSAFFLRGADYIIAAMQAVPDFYMPILVTLFYQSWSQLLDPHAALADAKRRLLNGAWYPDTADHLRSAYLPVLCETLARASTDRRAARSIDGWLLPRHIQLRYQDAFGEPRVETAWNAFTNAHCEEPTSRTAFAELVMAHLIESRAHLPSEVIQHLCIWVCGFGQPRGTAYPV